MSALLDRYRREVADLLMRLNDDLDDAVSLVNVPDGWAESVADGLLQAGLCGEYEVIAHVAGESETAAYSRLLRGMARRAVQHRAATRNVAEELAELRASMPAQEEQPPPPPFPPGTLVVYARREDVPQFALAIQPTYNEHAQEWMYGKHYVQFPTEGKPSGGASFSTRASELRLPSAPDERLLAAQYRAKARVLAAEQESKAAAAEYAALRQTLALIESVGTATNAEEVA